MPADRVRDEAERLVAAALAAVSYATRGLGTPAATSDGAGQGGSFATGSTECCVCPVCRAIAALRDPGSDLADRLAAGVGDLAGGVAAILRALSSRGGRDEAPEEASAAGEGDQFWEELRRKATDAAKAYAGPSTAGRSTVDDSRRAATREPSEGVDEPAPETLVPKPTVVKQAGPKKAVAKKLTAPGASQRELRDSREREERGTSSAIASKRDAERTGGAGTRGNVAKKAAAKKAAAQDGEA